MAANTTLKLPLEIIFMIIEHIPPATPIVLPPTHIATKTLLSLTLVSRSTQHVAQRMLLAHCLYIDTSRRLKKTVRTLQRWRDRETTEANQPTESDGEETHPSGRDDTSCTGTVASSLFSSATSLYLDLTGGPITPRNTANVEKLLALISSALRLLVFDMLDNDDDEDDDDDDDEFESFMHTKITRIQVAIVSCTRLEVLAAPRSTLAWLPGETAAAWARLPRLRSLALFEPVRKSVSVFFLGQLAALPHLKDLVVVASGLGGFHIPVQDVAAGVAGADERGGGKDKQANDEDNANGANDSDDGKGTARQRRLTLTLLVRADERIQPHTHVYFSGTMEALRSRLIVQYIAVPPTEEPGDDDCLMIPYGDRRYRHYLFRGACSDFARDRALADGLGSLVGQEVVLLKEEES